MEHRHNQYHHHLHLHRQRHPPISPKPKVDWNEALKHMVIEDAPKTSLDNLRRLISEAVLKERVERVRQAEKVKLPPPLCCISRKSSPALSSQICLTNSNPINNETTIAMLLQKSSDDHLTAYAHVSPFNPPATLNDIVNHVDVGGQIILEAKERAQLPRSRASGWLEHRHVRHSVMPNEHHPHFRELDIDPLDVAFKTKRVRRLLDKHDQLQKRIKNAVVQQYARYSERAMQEQQKDEERHRQRIAETVQQQYDEDEDTHLARRTTGRAHHRTLSRHARSEDDLLTRTRSKSAQQQRQQAALPDIIRAKTDTKVRLSTKPSDQPLVFVDAKASHEGSQKPRAAPGRSNFASKQKPSENIPVSLYLVLVMSV